MARRILLVEDDPSVRTAVRASLRSAGFEVTENAFGAGAAAKVEELAPDAVLLDLVLPDTGGLELLKQIRATPQGQRTAVIAFSGYYGTVEEARAANPGFDAYFLKPVKGGKLLQDLEDVLRQRKNAGP